MSQLPALNGHLPPLPTTHNTALSTYHIKVEDFVDRLRASVEDFFPNNAYRYKEVHVLLLSWQEDDLGVIDEVLELENVFEIHYGFHSVRRWEIPSSKPYSKLEDELYRFRKDHSSDDNLLIVYYAGHGYLDYSRLWKWAAYRDVSNKPPSPTLDWYAIQSGLEHAESDVLILLDSCAAAGSSGASKQFETQEGGTTELLAACGFETVAPGPGPHSFTNALIKELRDMSLLGFPFGVTMLHQRIVARLLHYSPQYSSMEPAVRMPSSSRRHPELRATPVYISLGRDFRQKNICLRPFQNANSSKIHSTSSNSSFPKPEKVNGSLSYRTVSAVKRLLGHGNAPKVLLAINLQGELWQNSEHAFTNWLKDMPIPTDSINVEAVFHGFSTMMLLTMPISVWDLLPEYPSCSFIGFVQSANLLPAPMSLVCPDVEKNVHVMQGNSNYDPGQHILRMASRVRFKWGLWTLSLMILIFFCRRYGWSDIEAFAELTFYALQDLWIEVAAYWSPRIISEYDFNGYQVTSAFGNKYNRGQYPLLVFLDTSGILVSCLFTIFVCVLAVHQLDNPETSGFLGVSGKLQVYRGQTLWLFRMLTPEYAFAMATINVIDNFLSQRELQKYAQRDGVPWTSCHARYAALGGFIVQRPDKLPTRAPISINARALLEMRRIGHLERLPDLDVTQHSKKSHNLTGYLLISQVAWLLMESIIRGINEYPIPAIVILACVFATFTLATYALMGNDLFSHQIPTKLTLRNGERFWSHIETKDDVGVSTVSQTRLSHAAGKTEIPRRRLLKDSINTTNMAFVMGHVAGCLTFESIIADDGPLTVPRKAISSWFFVYPAILTMSLWFRRPFSALFSPAPGRMESVLAAVAFGVGIPLSLQRLILVLGAIYSLAFSLFMGWDEVPVGPGFFFMST